MLWRRVGQALGVAAIVLLPGLLWLFLGSLPISATVPSPADGVRQVAVRLGPAGWLPTPVGRLEASAGAGVATEVRLDCPGILWPGQACAGVVGLAEAPPGPLVVRIDRRWAGLLVGAADVVVPGAVPPSPSLRR